MNELRTKMGHAIVRAFERQYQENGANYDPDTCYEAADEVLAVVVSELTGQNFIAERNSRVIGPAAIVERGE